MTRQMLIYRALLTATELLQCKALVSHTVRRLGVVYACYVRAVASVGTDASVTFDGSRHEDVFAQKAEWYKKELNELSAAVTASDFTGVEGKSNAVINLWRS